MTHSISVKRLLMASVLRYRYFTKIGFKSAMVFFSQSLRSVVSFIDIAPNVSDRVSNPSRK
jgi:hypothetical protein